jgi:hypothetical protein
VTVIPLDLVVDFSDVPALGRALRQAVSAGEVGYELDGIVGVETPPGRPTFGPMRLVSGTLSLQGAIGAVGAPEPWE